MTDHPRLPPTAWTAIRRGLLKVCPHCGEGPIFERWAQTRNECPRCGLVFERNAGDTWAFTIIGDRLPIAAAVVVIYFGLFRSSPAIGTIALVALAVIVIATAPNRWGVGIALHYLSRRWWPDPDDPIPS